MLVITVLFSLYNMSSALSAHIFYIYPIGCKSTSFFHHTVMKILINRGHEITSLSAIPLKNVLNHFDLGLDADMIKFSDSVSLTENHFGTYYNLRLIFNIQLENCKNIYGNKKIKNFVTKSKVDLVIIEYDSSDCYLPLAFSFKVPVIGISTTAMIFHDVDGFLGNPINPSYIPTLMSGFSSKMNFQQRLMNSWHYSLYWIFRSINNHKIYSIIPEYLRVNSTIEQLINEISLTFVNGHYSYLPRPLAANTISIAGIHVQDPSPLPNDIKNFIDNAENGVIYVSLGSVVKFSSISKELYEDFVEVFRNLPDRIIWRHDKPEMVNVSENILVKNWFPQKDILAHEKVKLFISHGGLLSSYEAIYYGVPLLAFPVLYDQYSNVANIQQLGIGLFVNFEILNKDVLRKSINEIRNNDLYFNNVKRISAIFKDRIKRPNETLIYWVEYILRNKGVLFMHSSGAKLFFYEYLLLDVIVFCLVSIGIIICIMKCTSKMIRNTVRSKHIVN